jgi:hypothetical protein
MKQFIFILALSSVAITSFSFIFNETEKKDCQWSSPVIRNCKLESFEFESDGDLRGRVAGVCPKCQRVSGFTKSFHFFKPSHSGQNDKWKDGETCYNHKGESENPVIYEFTVNVTSICK